MKRYYANIENGEVLYSDYSDDLKGLLFEMGKRAIDFIFDKGKEECELFTLQIYDNEKHENVYYTTICNVHGSIETIAENADRQKITRSEQLAKDGKIEVDIGTFEIATVIPDCNAVDNLRYLGTVFNALYNNCKVSANVYEDNDGKLFATIKKPLMSR